LKKAIFYNISFLFFALIFSVSVLGQSASDSSLAFPFSGSQSGGLFMGTPPNISSEVNYDLTNNQYFIQNKIGGLDAGRARTLALPTSKLPILF